MFSGSESFQCDCLVYSTQADCFFFIKPQIFCKVQSTSLWRFLEQLYDVWETSQESKLFREIFGFGINPELKIAAVPNCDTDTDLRDLIRIAEFRLFTQNILFTFNRIKPNGKSCGTTHLIWDTFFSVLTWTLLTLIFTACLHVIYDHTVCCDWGH